jgi:hypothetical protein
MSKHVHSDAAKSVISRGQLFVGGHDLFEYGKKLPNTVALLKSLGEQIDAGKISKDDAGVSAMESLYDECGNVGLNAEEVINKVAKRDADYVQQNATEDNVA